MITLYGIPNCDTVRKARAWLDHYGLEYRFHDLRENGLTATTVRRWAKPLGWESLLNRRSATWRGIPRHRRETLTGADAVKLMVESPTLIKRPVLEIGKDVYLGFTEQQYRSLLR